MEKNFTRSLSQHEIDQAVKELRYYGYTVVRSILNDTAIDFFRSLVVRLHEGNGDIALQNVSSNQANDKYVYNLQYKNAAFVKLLTDGNLKSILMNFLNDPFYKQIPSDKPNYVLSYFNARSSVDFLPLHIDSYLPSTGSFTWSMQTAYLLEDQDEDNGCTTVVPGSHLSGEFAERSLEKVVPLEAKAGDVLIWDSRLWHGAGKNHTGRSRWSMIATFRQWFLKPSMDIPRGTPEAIYEQLSDEERALLGFCCIPPLNETEYISMKKGYDSLKKNVKDYYVKGDRP